MPRLLALSLYLLGSALPAAETVVILPFFNLSNNPKIAWIGESIAESLHEALAGEGLTVVDRDLRQQAVQRLGFRSNAVLTRASIMRLGQIIEAGRVVWGTFEVSENTASGSKATVNITGHVIDLEARQQAPAFSVLGALDDLAELQTGLAWQTLRYAAPEAALAEETFRGRRPKIRVDAIESYVRGLLAADETQKHRLFAQAARLDPNYPQPCFQLGRLQWLKEDFKVAAEWFGRVTPAEPHFLEARFYLGLCRYYLADYAAAAVAFQVVAEKHPAAEVLNNLAAAQARLDSPQALENFRKALAANQGDPDYHFNLGFTLWRRGDFEAAADRFRAALDRASDDEEATVFLGRCIKRTGPRTGDPSREGLERLKEEYPAKR